MSVTRAPTWPASTAAKTGEGLLLAPFGSACGMMGVRGSSGRGDGVKRSLREEQSVDNVAVAAFAGQG